MDIRQLRNFHLVSRAGSIRKAAVDLHMAQPGLSRQISLLERELGVPLLIRTGRGVRLTAAGKIFAARIETLLRMFDEARDEISDLADEPTGQLSVGLPASLSAGLAAHPAAEFHARFPRVSLRIVEAQPTSLFELLETGRLDMAFVYAHPAARAHTVRELFTDQLFLFGAIFDDTLEDSIDFDELARLPLIIPGPANRMRMLIDSVAASRGTVLQVALEVDSLGVQKELVKSGLGYGVLPFVAIESEVRAGTLRAIRIHPAITRSIICATSSDKPLTRAAQEFLDLVVDEAEELVAERERLAPASRVAAEMQT